MPDPHIQPSSISISKYILGPSEPFSIHFLVHNLSNLYITHIGVQLYYSASDHGNIEYYALQNTLQSYSIAPNNDRGVNLQLGTINIIDKNISTNRNLFYYLSQNSERAESVVTRITFKMSDGTFVRSEYGQIGGRYVNIINKRYNPMIDSLQFNRCNASNVLDYDGEYVSTTIKTTFSNGGSYSDFKVKFTQMLPAVPPALTDTELASKIFDPSNSGDLSILESFETGVTNSNVLIGELDTFDLDNNYYITVKIFDPYESSTVQYSVPRSFINVHLSGTSTGGVAFGLHSNATENNPLFESNYKSRFYDDVTVSLGNLRVDSGSTVDKGQLYVSSQSELVGNVICRSGLTASNGTVSAKGLSAGASGVSSSGGLTVSSGGASITGGLTVASGGLSVQGNMVMQTNGATITTPKLSVSSGAGISGGLTVSSGGASITGGLTVASGGLAVNSGSANFKGGITNIKGGTTAGQSIPYSGNNYKDFTISYSGFTSTPYISCTLKGTENLSKCSVQITALSSTSCTCRVYNTGSANHNVSLNWIAYGVTS